YRKPLVANSCNRREPMFLVEHDPIAIRGEFPMGHDVKNVDAVLQSTCAAVEVLELKLLVAIQEFYSVTRLPHRRREQCGWPIRRRQVRWPGPPRSFKESARQDPDVEILCHSRYARPRIPLPRIAIGFRMRKPSPALANRKNNRQSVLRSRD